MIATAEDQLIDSFSVTLKIQVRPVTEKDLLLLEWDGAFRDDRHIIHDAFKAQERHENLMLLADFNGFPVGQIWIDLVKRRKKGAGYLWALRVFPVLQKLGIGKRLMAVAESVLKQRHIAFAELEVEKWNKEALKLYKTLGYHVIDSVIETTHYVTPEGIEQAHHVERWLLRKPLSKPPKRRSNRPLAGPTRNSA